MRNITREKEIEEHKRIKEKLIEYHNLLVSKNPVDQTRRDKIIIKLNNLKRELEKENSIHFQFKELNHQLEEENLGASKSLILVRAFEDLITKAKEENSEALKGTLDTKVRLLKQLILQENTILEASWNRTKHKFVLAFKDSTTNELIHISHVQFDQVLRISNDLSVIENIFGELHSKIKDKTLSYVKRYCKTESEEIQKNVDKRQEEGYELVKKKKQAHNPLLNPESMPREDVLYMCLYDVINTLNLNYKDHSRFTELYRGKDFFETIFTDTRISYKYYWCYIKKYIYVEISCDGESLTHLVLSPEDLLSAKNLIEPDKFQDLIEVIDDKPIRDSIYMLTTDKKSNSTKEVYRV